MFSVQRSVIVTFDRLHNVLLSAFNHYDLCQLRNVFCLAFNLRDLLSIASCSLFDVDPPCIFLRLHLYYLSGEETHRMLTLLARFSKNVDKALEAAAHNCTGLPCTD